MGRRRSQFVAQSRDASKTYLTPIAGEYLFASGDFVAFASVYPSAHVLLGNLCALKAAEVTLFVRECDRTVAERFVAQYHGSTRVVPLPDKTLLLLGQMIFIDMLGVIDLAICDDAGFLLLNSRPEALRIRFEMLQHVKS